MTNSPEATTPDSSRESTATDATAGPGATAEPGAAVGPEFGRIVEPRSENRLALESGVWHQISPKYVTVQLISTGSFLVIVIAATLVLTLLMHQLWAWIPGGIMTVILAWTLAILPRQARAIGYQLRDDDLVFRRGILWQRFVAVPYGRMQLIDITHGPLDRGFGIAQLKFVTAAAATGVVIPGLAQTTAETLRDHLVEVAESRRTGL
ncbi:MAG TPA: PH domain-containing protein [Microbacterium sp.]|nr:PH domain-containing protein [Microbacterium sp.]